MIRNIITFGMIMSSIINPAFAHMVASPDTAIKCIQTQLNLLGFNAGNEDGILQLETLKASKAYIEWAKKNDIDLFLPELNIKNAQIWCDAILKNSKSKI